MLRWHGTRYVAATWMLWAGGIGYPVSGAYDPRSGEFEVHGLPAGQYDLTWSSRFSDQDILLHRDLSIPEEPAEIDLGTLRVRFVAQPLLVRVLDASRKPIRSAIVRLPIGPGHTAARTNREGCVRWSIYDPTALEIFVSAPGFKDASRKLKDDEVPESVEFVVEKER